MRWRAWRVDALLDRRSLQYRITASVGAGLAAILLLFGYVAYWSIGQVTDAALLERQSLATTLAHHVGTVLAGTSPEHDDLDALQRVLEAFVWSADPEAEGLEVEVLDPSGTVIRAAGTRRAPPPGAVPHARVLADFIAGQRPGVRIHRPPPSTGRGTHIIAYAPLRLGGHRDGWGLAVEQGEDVVLSLPHRLRDQMAAIGALALVVASVLAWLDVRSVVRPLRLVTAAAQRIAAGDLSAPLAGTAPSRRDEVGQLTVSLETMRRRLLRSLTEISEWNQQLERRVRQRTRELAAISAQHRHLLNKVIWAQEEERMRLARELHDETVQTLSGLAMTLQAVEDDLPADLARQRERLDWAKGQAVHAAREIRQLILDLRPSVLDDLGLMAAVRWLAGTHLQPLGIVVEIDATDDHPPLPSAVQTTAFRVIQEAIVNVAKHAQARHVAIGVAVTDQALTAAVVDDGCGFDPTTVRAASLVETDRPAAVEAIGAGLGLLGMTERVALLGGHLEVQTRPGAGTRVRFTVPLRRESIPDLFSVLPSSPEHTPQVQSPR